MVADIIEEVLAAEGAVLIEKTLRDNLELIRNFREDRRYVIIPISRTVADKYTFQIPVREALSLIDRFMLVDLPGEVWCINTAIALTSDKEFIVVVARVWSILRELHVECL